MVQLRITKGVFAFIFLVVVQVFILRSMFSPTLLHSSDAPVDYDFVPEFLAYKSIEQEAFNADIEELQRRLESAHESLVSGTAANTKWQEEQEMKLAQEREQNEKERIEFHRLLEEATEKKNKKDRENKEKLLLLNRIVKNTFSEEEWEMRPVPDEWTTRHVMEWARRSLAVDSEDLLRLSKLKLSGKGLLKLRKEDLLSSSFPLGTATLMADEIASLKAKKEQKASNAEGGDHEGNKVSKRKRVVAVVGAGYGGMSTARELLENGCTPILIEESRKPGGIWIYDADPEVTSGYNSLHAQGAANDINFRNFIIPPTYTGRLTIHQMGTHMKNFWEKFNLEKYVVFNTMVTEIEVLGSPVLDPPQWLPVVTENKLFRVHWIKKEMKESDLVETTGYFDVDAVVEAIGRNHVPNLPTSNTSAFLRQNYIQGYDEYTGVSIHSKSYRVPADFVGKTVIVAGGGKSGHDVAEDLRKANVTTFHASQNQGDHNRITRIVQEHDGTFTVHFFGELSADSEKMLDLDDAKKPPAQAMAAIAERNKAKARWTPIHNVGAIIWAWGWKVAPVPVTAASNSVPLSKGFHNDVLSKDLPGYARVGTVSFLGTTRVQATYVGRVIGSRIPINTTSSDYNATQRNWGHPGSDQYVWHDLVSY